MANENNLHSYEGGNKMIYKKQIKVPSIHFINDDFKNQLDTIKQYHNVCVVTDPPFNIEYHYDGYNDRMNEDEYIEMLSALINNFPCVMVHYPEQLYKIAISCRKVPDRVCAWVYNSNTARQHRDIAFFGVKPNFKNTRQEYKNKNDKRIKERIARGYIGSAMYDWWNVNQVKNTNKDKTSHPCQMPVEIMKNIISTLPENTIVFDPFMGSGTTAVACIELGYDFIGCEINKEYYNIAKKRINA